MTMSRQNDSDGYLKRYRNRKRDKLVAVLEDSLGRSAERCKALADFLLEEDDFGPIDSMIERMATSPLSSLSLHSESPETKSRIQETLDSMRTTTIILKSLADVLDYSRVVALRDSYLQCLIEAWPSVMAWVSFLMLEGSDTTTVVSRVAGLVEAVITAAPGTELQEEILASKSTVDVVFILLCQKMAESGRHYVLKPLSKGKTRCLIVELVETYLQSQTGWEIMTQRLGSIKRSTRRTVIRSLVRRAFEVAEEAPGMSKRNVLCAMEDLSCLLRATTMLVTDDAMWAEFAREDFIFAYSTALYELSVEAATILKIKDVSFWRSIGQAARTIAATIITGISVDPVRYFPKAFQGGLLSACYHAMQHLPTDQSVEASTALVYSHAFLHHSRTGNAAEAHKDVMLFLDGNKSEIAVCRMISGAMYQNGQVYWANTGKDVSLCSSLQHCAGRPSKLADRNLMKTCVGCKSVHYCSSECQVADWDRLHQHECKALDKFRSERVERNMWLSLRRQQDLIRHIDQMLNGRNCETMYSVPLPYPPSSFTYGAMSPVDFDSPLPTNSSDDSPELTLTVVEYLRSTIPHICTLQPLSSRFTSSWATCPSEWRLRLQQYVLDLAEDPETVMLVEGVSRFNVEKTIVVVIKMRRRTVAENEDEDGKGQYEVVSSLSWLENFSALASRAEC